MNIYSGHIDDEYNAVERWENEGGRIIYKQFGRGRATDIPTQAGRGGRAASTSRLVMQDVGGNYSGSSVQRMGL